MLTEVQVVALERKRDDEEAGGEIETAWSGLAGEVACVGPVPAASRLASAGPDVLPAVSRQAGDEGGSGSAGEGEYNAHLLEVTESEQGTGGHAGVDSADQSAVEAERRDGADVSRQRPPQTFLSTGSTTRPTMLS